MAEEKKDAPSGVKKDAPKAPSGKVVWEEVLLLILGIVALLFVFIPRFFATDHIDSVSSESKKPFNAKDFYGRVFSDQTQTVQDVNGAVIEVKKPSLIDEGKSRLNDWVKTLSVIVFSGLLFLILLFNAIVYYNKFRTKLIIDNYKKKFYPEKSGLDKTNERILEASEPDTNGIINPRWQLIGKYYNSASQADWKLAILEADIMLFDVLNKSGFQGYSIGEMLKFTDKSKLATLDLAWRAHKIRNEIAHQGLDYVLTRQKVEEAISDYEKVFEELNFI